MLAVSAAVPVRCCRQAVHWLQLRAHSCGKLELSCKVCRQTISDTFQMRCNLLYCCFPRFYAEDRIASAYLPKHLIDPGLNYWTDQQTVMTMAIMINLALAPCEKHTSCISYNHVPSLSECRPARNGGGQRMSIWQLGGHQKHPALKAPVAPGMFSTRLIQGVRSGVT